MGLPALIRLKEKFGEDTIEDLQLLIRETVKAEGISRDEREQILARFDGIDRRFDQLRTDLDNRFDRFRADIEARLDRFQSTFDARFDAVNERLGAMQQRFEERLGGLERQFNERLGSLEQRFDERLGSLVQRLDERLDKMNERLLSSIRWTVGTIALFGTLISLLLTIFKFTGP